MFLPLREFNIFGMLVEPAAALLVMTAALFLLIRWGVNRFVDVNRFVWRRPVIDLAIFVILYALAILTVQPI